MKELDERVAIITGAGSGIGRATALRFAREGARVAIVDIDDARAQQVQQLIREEEGNAFTVHCDVSAASEVEAMVTAVVDRMGKIDVLVNCAGISGGDGRTAETSLEVWGKTIAINLTGSFLTTRFTLPEMLRNGMGSIINLGSIFALSGLAGDVSYAASKGGVVQLTRTTALEYARRGIRVNCICPGYVETPLLDSQTGDLNPKGVATVVVPMGHVGTPEDVADLAVFLASDRASFMTGAVISIDGGMSAR